MLGIQTRGSSMVGVDETTTQVYADPHLSGDFYETLGRGDLTHWEIEPCKSRVQPMLGLGFLLPSQLVFLWGTSHHYYLVPSR